METMPRTAHDALPGERVRNTRSLDKVVRIGTSKTCGGRGYSTFCHIQVKDGRLSITGVEGPLPSGNAIGGCGQITPKVDTFAPGWTPQLLERLIAIWDRWHLNDMRAGTPQQEDIVREHASEYPGYPKSHYEWACELLDRYGLLSDDGYKYGSKWLIEPLPQDIIDELRALPTTDRKPAWI